MYVCMAVNCFLVDQCLAKLCRCVMGTPKRPLLFIYIADLLRLLLLGTTIAPYVNEGSFRKLQPRFCIHAALAPKNAALVTCPHPEKGRKAFAGLSNTKFKQASGKERRARGAGKRRSGPEDGILGRRRSQTSGPVLVTTEIR